MNQRELTKKAKGIIEKILYITIATVDKDGLPWNTPVYSAYDGRYVFYWTSSPKARHSINIDNNPNVAFVIYDSTVPEGTGVGVYIKAKASVVKGKSEIEKACKILYPRKKKPVRPAEDFMGGSPMRIYKAMPQRFWVNEDVKIKGRIVDARVEVFLL